MDLTTGLDEFGDLLPEDVLEDMELIDRAIERGGRGSSQEVKRQLLQTRRAAVAEIDPDDPGTRGRVARNQQCPCGSGKKYKHCHGRH